MSHPQKSFSEIKKDYAAALFSGDVNSADQIISSALEHEISARKVYCELIIGVLTEHLKTVEKRKLDNLLTEKIEEISLRQMDALRKALPTRQRILNLQALVAPIPADRHFICTRAIADLLEMDGWKVNQIQRSLTLQELHAACETHQPDLLGLSVMDPALWPTIPQVVRATSDRFPRMKLVVTGLATKLAPNPDAKMNAIYWDTDTLGAFSKIRNSFPEAFSEEINANLLKQVGAAIQRLRKSRQLSQDDLGTLCEIDRTYISQIENGKQNVTILGLARIADALEVDLSTLLEPPITGWPSSGRRGSPSKALP